MAAFRLPRTTCVYVSKHPDGVTLIAWLSRRQDVRTDNPELRMRECSAYTLRSHSAAGAKSRKVMMTMPAVVHYTARSAESWLNRSGENTQAK